MQTCKACGRKFSEHLGVQGTCEELQEANAEVRRLREEVAMWRRQEAARLDRAIERAGL